RSPMEPSKETFGIPITQAVAPTRTSPRLAPAQPPADAEAEEHWKYRTKTGRVSPLADARIVDALGEELPQNGELSGELELRGPWIAAGYYEDAEATAEKIHDGWLRTGDVATIDPRGYIQITDRAKDVIKSGGEWISSV